MWTPPRDADDKPTDVVAPATGSTPSVMDVVLGRLKGHGSRAHRVWLPPLADPPSLDWLLPALTTTPEFGLSASSSPLRGSLAVPVGLLDRPYEQRRDPLVLDFSAAAGHGVIVGGPQSGKSATLRTVLTGLCLLNTPAELQIYCLDFGGGALSALNGLPHVGVVANRLQRELVTRTVNQVARLLDRRESAFVEAGVDSVQEWRRRIRSGELAPDGYGDVFLVIDGWGVLREKYEDLELLVTSIAARGLNFGVHVLIAAARWAEVRPALRDLLATRLELRLGDPTDSEINGKKAALVPTGQPGRGLTPAGLQFLSAVSRIDGRETAADLAPGVADLVRRVAAGWTGEPAAPVRLLPPHLDYAVVRRIGRVPRPGNRRPRRADRPGRGLRTVVLGSRTRPASDRRRRGRDRQERPAQPADAGRGRDQDAEDTQFVLVDPRRGLLDVLGPQWLSGTAVVPDEAASMLAGCRRCGGQARARGGHHPGAAAGTVVVARPAHVRRDRRPRADPELVAAVVRCCRWCRTPTTSACT